MKDQFAAIKKAGHRMTNPRKEIFKVLTYHPLTTQEVFQSVQIIKQNHDLTTVYRTLELFVTLGLVNKIQFEDNIARYELSGGHHHHLVCDHCGNIEDVPLSEESILKEVNEKSKFKVLRHQLEFFGLCSHCQ